MAKVIDFYIPHGFYKGAESIPAEERGKLVEFKMNGSLPEQFELAAATMERSRDPT